MLRSSPPVCTGAFANWTLWLDTLGVEQGNHSCIAYYPTEQATFSAARVACGAISPAAHMLTTRQVGGPDAGHRLELLHCTLRLHVCLLVWLWCLVQTVDVMVYHTFSLLVWSVMELLVGATD